MDRVADELAIRTLVASYADAVNRRDQDQWASTWSAGGVWNLAGTEVAGRDAVVQLWAGAMGSFEFVVQLVYQGTIEFTDEGATGRWYLNEHLRGQGEESGRFTIGCYEDEYVLEDGRWVFARRDYKVLYNDDRPGTTAGTVIP